MNAKFDFSNAERNFAMVLSKLQPLPGLDIKAIIRGEAGSILKNCVAKTRVASTDKLRLDVRQRILSKMGLTRGGRSTGGVGITVNVGKRGPFGRVFIKTTTKAARGKYRRTHGDGFVPLNQHYKDAVWSELATKVSAAKSAIERAEPDAIKSAGLARQSWLSIAAALKIDLTKVAGGGISAKLIRQAEAARGRNNRIYTNGTAKEEASDGKYAVTLINRYPLGSKLRFGGILQAAIAGRVKYIQTTFQRGVFESADQVIKKFKGWRVT